MVGAGADRCVFKWDAVVGWHTAGLSCAGVVVVRTLEHGPTCVGVALAQSQSADDKKWVAQCIKDNKNEGAKPEVVHQYCVCMNDKMDETETRSISQWEKANPQAMKACEKEAGWK